MGKPRVEIEVDDATGRWSVDTIPMMLVPQHFFLNNHRAVEAALGRDRLEEVLRPAGHRSAYVWCEREAAYHGLSGPDVFRHYMRRLSQRGWAQFRVLSLEPEAGRAEIRVDQSCFCTGGHPGADDPVMPGKRCYMFGSWFEGALAYVAASAGRPVEARATEVLCAAEGHDHCLFSVAPVGGAAS